MQISKRNGKFSGKNRTVACRSGLLFVLVLFVGACAAEPSLEESPMAFTEAPLVQASRPAVTASPTSMPTHPITATPPPTLIPLLINGWEESAGGSVCIQLEEDYGAYSALNITVPDQTIGAVISELLGPLMRADVAETCSLTLHVSIRIAPLSDQYRREGSNELFTCYSGASLEGEMALENMENVHLISLGRVHAPDYSLETCPQAPLFGAEFRQLWQSELLLGLTELWGVPMYLNALHDAGMQSAGWMIAHQIPPRAVDVQDLMEGIRDPQADIRAVCARLLGALDPADLDAQVVAALQASLEDDAFQVQMAAAESLGRLGPASAQAVPALIDLIDPGNPAHFVFQQALIAITGENLGDDPQAWRSWWEGRVE